MRTQLQEAGSSPTFRFKAIVTHGSSVLEFAGMPKRFTQEALGHNSKAVHRAYAKRALMKIPSLEEYEREVTDCMVSG